MCKCNIDFCIVAIKIEIDQFQSLLLQCKMSSTQCEILLSNGRRCKTKVANGSICYRHGGVRKTIKKQCTMVVEDGKRCSNELWKKDDKLCYVHSNKEGKKEIYRCGANTNKGSKCQNRVKLRGTLCRRHDKNIDNDIDSEISKNDDADFHNENKVQMMLLNTAEHLTYENKILRGKLLKILEVNAEMTGFKRDSPIEIENFDEIIHELADFINNL
uniref:Uncharacterized protein n=1 Tax=Pithovirus LCPAC404 TaxID=2506597 RepID=A0A481ZDS9_9VIRU|nr:MAG: hypothetical protein LCPAC404_01660 [Pithovirus LCPAC404]